MQAIDLDKLNEDGYLVLRGILADDPILPEIAREYAALYTQMFVKLSEELKHPMPADELNATRSIDHMVALLLAAGGHIAMDHIDPLMNYSLPTYKLRTDLPCAQLASLFQLTARPALLDCVEQVLGGEIVCLPTTDFSLKISDELHVKIHRLRREIGSPHPIGDNGSWKRHFGNPAWHTLARFGSNAPPIKNMVSLWVPLSAGTKTNGGLKVIRGSHNLYARRSPGPDELQKAIQLPVERGDAILLKSNLFVTTTNNISKDSYAWAISCKYLPLQALPPIPNLPTFIARSRSDPNRELADPIKWQRICRAAFSSIGAGKKRRSRLRLKLQHSNEQHEEINAHYRELLLTPDKWLAKRESQRSVDSRWWSKLVPARLRTN